VLDATKGEVWRDEMLVRKEPAGSDTDADADGTRD